MKTIVLALGLAALAPPAGAEDWNCRNTDLEISCQSGQCQSSESFTPLDVSVHDDGSLTVCAYSGCWDGVGEIGESNEYLMVTASELVAAPNGLEPSEEGEEQDRPRVMIGIDTRDGVSVFNGFGYAMPMMCERR